MKDKGEAITAVVLLGLGLSAIIRALVIGGSGFGTEACQTSSLGDCILSLFLLFWVVAAILVGSSLPSVADSSGCSTASDWEAKAL